ncbi:MULTISPECIES: hypothetical protein [Geobacillus]|uniref:hypothetical protein n=1 Tax=Geobacillus TaxID=129337 RepID=UPI000A67D555|nr:MULTISPECIES: hypothetical protein [Geobacillus]WPZ20168.1 hypothetical protein UM396_04695 [Geobacillus subterraneus]
MKHLTTEWPLLKELEEQLLRTLQNVLAAPVSLHHPVSQRHGRVLLVEAKGWRRPACVRWATPRA